MNRTPIEWVRGPDGQRGYTWNPVTGCTPVSPGCAHCYAAAMAKRLAGRCGYQPSPHEFAVMFHQKRLREPLRIKKPSRIFVSSMGDLFHKDVQPWMIRDVYDVMAAARHQTFVVCTKRPERFVPALYDEESRWYFGGGDYLPNVWHLTSCENQEWFDKRVPHLLKFKAEGCGAWTVGVSLEPLLGPIDLSEYIDRLAWVIVGGESGPGARPMHPDWVRSIRDQCQAAGVPFLFKQWGAWVPGQLRHDAPNRHCYELASTGEPAVGSAAFSFDDPTQYLVGEVCAFRYGKKAAGRKLDGRTWDEFPGESKAKTNTRRTL